MTKQNMEFDELYQKYYEQVKTLSGGLVETNKRDFLKQYVFFDTVVNPVITKYVEAFLGKNK